MWPAIMKCNWMVWCRPVSTLHMRYCTMVLFLFTAVVSMQTGVGFAEAMIVQQTDNCVRSLARITGLISNEVHLARNSLAADPKDGGLPRC